MAPLCITVFKTASQGIDRLLVNRGATRVSPMSHKDGDQTTKEDNMAIFQGSQGSPFSVLKSFE